jgi:hypothetical protein
MSNVVITKASSGSGSASASASASACKPHVTNAEKIAKMRETIHVKNEEHNKLYYERLENVKLHIGLQNKINDELAEIDYIVRNLKYKKRLVEQKKREAAQLKKTISKQLTTICNWNAFNRITGKYTGKKSKLCRDMQTLEIKEYVINTQKELVLYEKENKKKVSKTKILEAIDKLPGEIVSYIGEFIPYEIRNQLIEKKYNPMKLVKNLDADVHVLSMLIKKFYLYPKYFSQLSAYEADQNTTSSRNYSPAWWGDNRSKMLARLMRPIVEMKRKDPEIAYRFLSTIAILFKPDKKYTLKLLHTS